MLQRSVPDTIYSSPLGQCVSVALTGMRPPERRERTCADSPESHPPLHRHPSKTKHLGNVPVSLISTLSVMSHFNQMICSSLCLRDALFQRPSDKLGGTPARIWYMTETWPLCVPFCGEEFEWNEWQQWKLWWIYTLLSTCVCVCVCCGDGPCSDPDAGGNLHRHICPLPLLHLGLCAAMLCTTLCCFLHSRTTLYSVAVNS